MSESYADPVAGRSELWPPNAPIGATIEAQESQVIIGYPGFEATVITPGFSSITRQRMINKLTNARNYMPRTVENCPYDGDASVYVSTAQQLVVDARETLDWYDPSSLFARTIGQPQTNKDSYSHLNVGWLDGNYMQVGETLMRRKNLALVFESVFSPMMKKTLEAISLTPPLLAKAQFEERRDAILAKLPRDQPALARMIRSGRLTMEKVRATEESVHAQKSILPISDFWRMTKEERGDIVNVVGNECLQICDFAARHDALDILQKIDPPLLLKPAADLHALYSNLGDPRRALRQFFDVHPKVAERKKPSERSPEVTRPMVDLKPGQMVYLAPPNAKVGVPKFQQIVQGTLEAVARQLYAMSPNAGSQPQFDAEWQSAELVDSFTNDFTGNFRGLCLQAVPITVENVDALLDCRNTRVTPKLMRRYYLMAQRTSSLDRMQPPLAKALEVLVYVQQKPDMRLVSSLTVGRQYTGEEVDTIKDPAAPIAQATSLPGIMKPMAAKKVTTKRR